MKAISVLVGRNAKMVEIGSDVDTLQSYVGGPVEIIPVYISGRKTENIIVCNEEAKLRRLPKNRQLQYKHGLKYALYGNFLICGRTMSEDGESAWFSDINPYDVDVLLEELNS